MGTEDILCERNGYRRDSCLRNKFPDSRDYQKLIFVATVVDGYINKEKQLGWLLSGCKYRSETSGWLWQEADLKNLARSMSNITNHFFAMAPEMGITVRPVEGISSLRIHYSWRIFSCYFIFGLTHAISWKRWLRNWYFDPL